MRIQIYVIVGMFCLGSIRAAEPVAADQWTGPIVKKQNAKVVRERAAQGGKTQQASGKRGSLDTAGEKTGVQCNGIHPQPKNKAGFLCNGVQAQPKKKAGVQCDNRAAKANKAGITCNARATKANKAGVQCNGIHPQPKNKAGIQCNGRAAKTNKAGFLCDGRAAQGGKTGIECDARAAKANKAGREAANRNKTQVGTDGGLWHPGGANQEKVGVAVGDTNKAGREAAARNGNGKKGSYKGANTFPVDPCIKPVKKKKTGERGQH